jgi:N-acyl-phosphatidylethanolamine-hydrolysing phospholipase D
MIDNFVPLFLWTLLILVIMGVATSREWEPAENFGLFEPPSWPEEHHDPDGKMLPFKVNGQYQNPAMKDRPNVLSFFWSALTGKDDSNIPSAEELDKTLPVRTPNWTNTISEARMTWLGHASVLAEVDGKAVLTDPIFSNRASAVQFAGPARYRYAPCKISDLPNLDAVVISHNHYDHLDLNSVAEIARIQPNTEFFVPMGLKSWMESNTVAASDNIHEMTWWQQRNLKDSDVKIVFTPANHWCKRSVSDDNKVLWGSWAVLGPRNSFWFGGDTGYFEGFKQIGDAYGPFTMAAIPIGAYQPNWFMKYQHVHPGEAVRIHQDIRSSKSLGIHWGTFKLTFEDYLEPPRLLKEYLQVNKMSPDEFVSINIGESI